MSLVIECDWESATTVRAPELAATWCRLRIVVDTTVATVIGENRSPRQLRDSIDVSAYPLAEWLALNWWALSTESHRPGSTGVGLADAGDGFPGPDLTLTSDRDQMWITVIPRVDPQARITLISALDAVLDRTDVINDLALFIDGTVRRLEDAGISGTLLQEEWGAIQSAPADEREFALVAAAWGLDPYNAEPCAANALLAADRQLRDPALLADLARAVALSDLSSADTWLVDATRLALQPRPLASALDRFPGPVRSSNELPWREGYWRARGLRQSLGLSDTDLAPIAELVAVGHLAEPSPANIDALVRQEGNALAAVVGPQIPQGSTRERFIGARTIARRMTRPHGAHSLLTTGSTYSDRLERAFAAEFLAPAEGLRVLLDGDFSETAQHRVAHELRVAPQVVEYQVENQLAS
ncbi:MAG: ImmA/IrrE family metallo-endopeptidase [Cellulomonadaceae bacterium]